MARFHSQAGRRAAAYWAAALAAALCAPSTCLAATPESPEVKAAISKALTWLAKQDDDRLGGKCLVGMCFYKAGGQLNHPKIVAAQRACEAGIAKADSPDTDNYSLGLALIYLCEVDPARNRKLAERYLGVVLKRQKSHGGWGYDGNPDGDISQTQYPVLGMWLAANNGIDVPNTAVEKACAYLLRTQDPSGGWGYQGVDPGRFQRVAQMDVRPSLAAAGLGALYISADMLGVTGKAPAAAADADESALPAALRPVGQEQQQPRRRSFVTKAFDHAIARRGMADGDAWLKKQNLASQTEWFHYFLYAFERYHSFRELALDLNEPEPQWYNDLVAVLLKSQAADGHWAGEDNEVIATSFTTLFLLRSARKTIAHLANSASDGVLLGRMGLPPSTTDLRERDGKIVETPFAGSVDELIALISDGDNPALGQLKVAAAPLDSDVTKRSGQIARLRAVVTAGSIDSRLIAVRTLGRSRELDSVPILIYALSSEDPQAGRDLRLVKAADEALRFISRKFGGVGLPAEPDDAAIRNAVAAWKAWYSSIRPNAEFLD